MASFFYCGRLSAAQLDRWQAPKQWPIIDQRRVEQTAFQREIKDLVTMDLNPWLVRQRHRSWIKGLVKNPQKESTRSLIAVPFVRGHLTVTPGMDCICVNCHDGMPHVACLQVFRQNTQKSECVYRRSPIGPSQQNFAGLYGIRCKNAKILPIDNRMTFKHAFWFLRGWPEALSTRHTWHAIVQPDMYTRNCFSESMGHGGVAPDRRYCKQWTSSLYLLIFA